MMFWSIAAVMIVVALAAVMMPLLRGGDRATGRDVAASIHRQRLDELQAERRAGALADSAYEEAVAELKRGFAAEASPADTPLPQRAQGRRAAIVAAMVFPVVAAGLYVWLGEPGAIEATASVQAAAPERHPAVGRGAPDEQHDVDDMAATLEKRLAAKPDDADGWILLGRTYMYSKRADDAVKAFERARTLKPDDAKLLADSAEALAVVAGNRLEGEPSRMLRASLERDPGNTKALWLAGVEQMQKGDRSKAVGFWKRLREQLPADGNEREMLDGYIAQAGAPASAAGPRPLPRAGVPATTASTAKMASLRVRVALDPAMTSRTAPDDTVFIYARASNGPRMPLALIRKTVRELPVEVLLDDSLAMGPGMTLSGHDEVIVAARVSKSGEAMARAGDVEGQSGVVRVSRAGPVDVRIERVVQ